MTSHQPGGGGAGSHSKFQGVQAGRDLETNWEVDVANKLEEYLLKICSGEVSSPEDINFAEAALLLQGSVQVYSRKVEYLYGLVLHALDFLSQKRQQDQLECLSAPPEQSSSRTASDEDDDQFWAADDVPVEARNCLDASTSKDASCYHFVKPPANLVVLEGDCLDATADGGELESFLLATNDLYWDFILLDPCDVVAVDDFLKGAETVIGQNATSRGSSACKSFKSPTRHSEGTTRKSLLGKNPEANLNRAPADDNSDMGADPLANDNFEDDGHGLDMGGLHEDDPTNMEDSDSDEDDPWKPLNPHEPGKLKVKPFRKVKAFRRNGVNTAKRISTAALFPLARLQGTISPELTKIWEARCIRFEKDQGSKCPPLYEKLRQSLVNGGHNAAYTFDHAENDNNGSGHDWGVPDFGQSDDEMPDNLYMDEDSTLHQKKDGANKNNAHEAFGHEDPISQTSLEDLCRSHLDALLANIAETEKQTELAARVSSWKQKIEHNLEEQDSRPPFDIHAYGEKILDKLSLEEDTETGMSFAEVVRGQEKHDVARTFSALLQLVNNGDVHLDRSGVGGESICYTAVNPFHIRLLSNDKGQEEAPFRLPRKRIKSPIRKKHNKFPKERSPMLNSDFQRESTGVSLQPHCKFSAKIGKVGGIRCTPEGKRRRRSRLVETVDPHSTG